MVELRDTPLPVSPCPYCDYKLSGAMAGDPNDPDATPSEGDFSVCISCAQVLQFNADLTLRKPAPGEAEAELRRDPHLAAIVRHVQRLVRGVDRQKLS